MIRHPILGGSSQRILFGGRNYFPQGRGRGRGGGVKCYAHMSWEFPERKIGGGEARIYEAQKNVEEKEAEGGNKLMMRTVYSFRERDCRGLLVKQRIKFTR
jgi:hypothetical protein